MPLIVFPTTIASKRHPGAGRPNPAIALEYTPAWHGGLHLTTEHRSSRSRAPHPIDILYWVTCIGAVGLLLFAAT